MTRRLLFPALLALLGVGACQWLVPLHADGPPTPDAGGAAGPADPCGPVPPRPTASVDAGDGRVIVLAAYYLGYDNGNHDFLCQESGLNLDGLDTTGLGCTPVACRPIEPDAGACDGPNGADNALAQILGKLSTQTGQDPGILSAFSPQLALQKGVLNLLFQLSNYNGALDDDHVDVAVLTSSGITGLEPTTSFEFDELAKLPDQWDGGQENVEWTVDERSVNGDAGELVLPKVLASGYVKDGILVVPSTGPLSLPPLVGSPVVIQDGILMGKLSNESGHWQLTDGRIATRVASAELLGVIGASRLASTSQLCDPKSFLYPSLRGDICASLDLPADGGLPDAATPCGALSMAFTIASVESKITTRTGPNNLQTIVTGKSGFHGRPPCADDAGTIWCDDCAWPTAARCPPPAE